MTRAERNEFNQIRGNMRDYQKQGSLGYGSTLTIRTDPHFFDDRERILYIYGLTWEMNGSAHPWTELYTREEKDAFAQALN